MVDGSLGCWIEHGCSTLKMSVQLQLVTCCVKIRHLTKTIMKYKEFLNCSCSPLAQRSYLLHLKRCRGSQQNGERKDNATYLEDLELPLRRLSSNGPTHVPQGGPPICSMLHCQPRDLSRRYLDIVEESQKLVPPPFITLQERLTSTLEELLNHLLDWDFDQCILKMTCLLW